MRTLRAYALAALSVTIAVLLTLGTPADERSPFLFLVVGVMISAARGFWPGVFATLLSLVLALYFIIPPSDAFSLSSPRDVVPLLLFGAVGIAVTVITDSLRRSKEEIRAAAAIIDSSADVIIRKDLENKILSWNKAAEHTYGYTAQEAIGHHMSLIIPPDHLEELGVVTGRMRRGGSVQNLETVHVRKDGMRIYVALTVSPVQDREGRIVGTSTIARDITGRKRADDALRESEQRFRAIFDQAAVGVAQVGRDERFVAANNRLCEILGYTRDELLGKTIRDLTYPDDADASVALSRSLMAGEVQRYTMEKRYRRKDGSAVLCTLFASLVRDESGRPKYAIGVMEDITERKRAEQELAEAHRRTAAILESISDGFNSFDREWRYTYVNPAGARMLGMKADELLGKSLWEVFPKVADSPFGAAYRRAMAENVPVQVEAFYPEPLNRWYQVRCYPSPEGLSLFLTDTTEHRRAEERLRQAHKLESLGLLAGGIAHDFNNLLVGVIGNASLAQRLLPAGHEAAQCLEDIVKSGEKAAHLTRQMLAYAGKGRFVVQPLSLSLIAEDLCGLVRSSISKRIFLQTDFEADLPAVEADPSQIEQVVMNLLINAAEAIGDNSGLISVKTGVKDVDGGYIERDLEDAEIAPGRYVFLDVRDTGCGMDEATRSRIFDPFFTTKFTGRGLGLAAVAGIVRGHKGAIRVSTTSGKGTSFEVFFPACDGAAVPAPGRQEDEDLAGSETILVVDDEEAVRLLAKKGLERYGYGVLLAESGPAAVGICKAASNNISLIVLDLSMPGMDGREALPELLKVKPDVRVVISSGYGEAETLGLFSESHISGFIQKPYTIQQLARKVRATLMSEA